jgi:glycine cleavage system aminomethyltransferase T
VASKRGAIYLPVQASEEVGLGQAFIAMHWGDEFVSGQDAQGQRLGEVTSGLLAPTVDQAIAMAYLPPEHAAFGHTVYAQVRGKPVAMVVSALPFNPTRYYRG